jgi:alkylation response protein AidB-like acyl-CoA dehydrogenase
LLSLSTSKTTRQALCPMFKTLKDLLSFEPCSQLVLDRLAPLCDRLGEIREFNLPNRDDLKARMNFLGEYGVFRWFVPGEFEGWQWSEQEILCGYLALSQADLSASFVLTQWNAATKRMLSSSNRALLAQYMERLARGELFTTVGISHLSTSRQHVKKPAVQAEPVKGGFQLNGVTPWVTAAAIADLIVLGATLNNGEQILIAVETSSPGVIRNPGMKLVALSDSCTDQVKLEDVFVPESHLISGPMERVLQNVSVRGGGVGGLHTSTLALGLAIRATDYLRQESENRPELASIAEKFVEDGVLLLQELFGQLDDGASPGLNELRQRANSLVMRTTQAALQAAKGAGFLEGHPAGRWAREALFFLVWSCPQEVVTANLCELAGLE